MKQALWHTLCTKAKRGESHTQDPGRRSPSRGWGWAAAVSPSRCWPTAPACSRLGAKGASGARPPWGFTSCPAGKSIESQPTGRQGGSLGQGPVSSVPRRRRQGSTGCCPGRVPGSSGPSVAATPLTSSDDSKLKWRFYPVLRGPETDLGLQ